jgi:hypothetical protein
MSKTVDFTSDIATFFMVALLEQVPYNNALNGVEVWLNVDGNLFNMKLGSNNTAITLRSTAFSGGKLTVTPNNTDKILVGVSENLDYYTQDQIMGFYVNQVNSSINGANWSIIDASHPYYGRTSQVTFSNDDATGTGGTHTVTNIPEDILSSNSLNLCYKSRPLSYTRASANSNNTATAITYPVTLNLDLPTVSDDLTFNQFQSRLFNLVDYKGTLVYSDSSCYSLDKNISVPRNFTMTLSNYQVAPLFVILNYDKPFEYAIDHLSHSKDRVPNPKPHQRAARTLYNNYAAPTRGRYNGWRMNCPTAPVVNWCLYDNRFDENLSANSDMRWFWVVVHIISAPASAKVNLTLNKDSNKSYDFVIPAATTGPVLLILSDTDETDVKTEICQAPYNTNFNIKNLASASIVKSVNVNNLSNVVISDDGNLSEYYVESYGYSYSKVNLPDINRAVALRQYNDFRFQSFEQVSLDTDGGYELLLKKFIVKNISSPTSELVTAYPMDRYYNSTLYPSAQAEDLDVGSVGWFYKNLSSSPKIMDLNLACDSGIDMFFIELIVKKCSSVDTKLSGGQSLTLGHNLYYYHSGSSSRTPFTRNPINNYDFPYLSQNLNNNVNMIHVTSGWNTNFYNVMVGLGDDVEVVSYGYTYASNSNLPVHYLTRWQSEFSYTMVRNIDGYLVVRKDASINVDEPGFIDDSHFWVKAYGDFFKGEYIQDGNQYDNIRVTTRINPEAVNKAFYILEDSNINNYNINPSGLRYTTDAVAIVDRDGIPVRLSGDNASVLVNNKYIMGDFMHNYPAVKNTSMNCDDYITDNSSDNLLVFNKNGGLGPVLLQGIYAALFKAFNKSSGILNAGFLSSMRASGAVPLAAPGTLKLSLTSGNNFINTNLNNKLKTYYYCASYLTFNGKESTASALANIVSYGNYVNVEVPYSNDARINKINVYRYSVDNINNSNPGDSISTLGSVNLCELIHTVTCANNVQNTPNYITVVDELYQASSTQKPNTGSPVNNNEDFIDLGSSLASLFQETDKPVGSSPLFNLYITSGRYAQDLSVNGTGLDNNSLMKNETGFNTIPMNLENMELKFKCKLRGLVNQLTNGLSNQACMISEALCKQIFGDYIYGEQPITLVRKVTRKSLSVARGDNSSIFVNVPQTFGVDERGEQLEMITQTVSSSSSFVDVNGNNVTVNNYSSNVEIQYEIIIKISLIQKGTVGYDGSCSEVVFAH